MALGTGPNHLALQDSNIVLTERNLIAVKGTKTSMRHVYAGGDAVTGAATVILANASLFDLLINSNFILFS